MKGSIDKNIPQQKYEKTVGRKISVLAVSKFTDLSRF